MKSKHLLMALLSGGLAFGSCTSTPHVPEGKYLIAGITAVRRNFTTA